MTPQTINQKFSRRQPVVGTKCMPLLVQFQPMVEKEHAGDVIRKRLTELGLTQAELAERVDVSPYAVTKWIQTGKISRVNAVAVAKALDLTLDQLLTVRLIVHGSDEIIGEPGGKYFFVNKVASPRLSAGNGTIVFEHEEIDNSHAFRTSWLQKNGYSRDKLKLFPVDGFSMSPTMEDGEIVLVNLADTTIRSGKIYAILVDDEPRIKRLFKRSDGSIEIRSDNLSPQFPVEVVGSDAIKELRIIGRVVWRGGEM